MAPGALGLEPRTLLCVGDPQSCLDPEFDPQGDCSPLLGISVVFHLFHRDGGLYSLDGVVKVVPECRTSTFEITVTDLVEYL